MAGAAGALPVSG